jgi:hypothetical protein
VAPIGPIIIHYAVIGLVSCSANTSPRSFRLLALHLRSPAVSTPCKPYFVFAPAQLVQPLEMRPWHCFFLLNTANGYIDKRAHSGGRSMFYSCLVFLLVNGLCLGGRIVLTREAPISYTAACGACCLLGHFSLPDHHSIATRTPRSSLVIGINMS